MVVHQQQKQKKISIRLWMVWKKSSKIQIVYGSKTECITVVQSVKLNQLIYNEEKNRIAIFKQSTGEFITFCEPTDQQQAALLDTGNFGGQPVGFRGQAKNIPPTVEAEQNVDDEITLIDSFSSHVMSITPSPTYESSRLDEGQNPGFTPLNSFESDVMGITPLDSSSSDYQI